MFGFIRKMISFIVHFIRRHFLIIICCVITALLWDKLSLYAFGGVEKASSEPRTSSQLKSDQRILTAEELATFDGIKQKELYLSILGSVYDVSRGAKHYGAGGSYNYFVGKDASVAFISGEFDKAPGPDNDDDDVLKHLKPRDIRGIANWKKFYDKDYIFVGLLSGRYYDANGHKTRYMEEVEDQIQIAIEDEEQAELVRQQYPMCNIEWKAETGTRVWCTHKSGGTRRDWEGVPRKFFQPGHTDFRCACVPDDRLDDSLLKEYDNCESTSRECFYKVD